MRCTAFNINKKGANTLARNLQRVAIAAWLQHKHGTTCLRTLFNQRTRRVRTNFLIGRNQDFHLRHFPNVRQTINRLHNAGLHVEDAWAAHNVALARKLSVGNSSHRKHGVVMANDQHLCVVATLPMHMRAFARLDNCRGCSK